MYDKFRRIISQENPEWKATLFSRRSATSKLLLSKFMRWEGKKDAINVSSLMSMALLHCPTSRNDTSKIFYQLLQGGGVESHTTIAAVDDEIPIFFEGICKFVTTELV